MRVKNKNKLRSSNSSRACEADVSLPPHAVLGIPLLLYELFDLSPESLQVLLRNGTKGRMKH